ncbi:type VII secretion protein EccB [Kineosporia mesophila]|uniref:Type VII secretion protein EccB n=1 Tax=Kineosporia mesophila TaxID=566012 RepID=A0ABP6ZXG0_9ACTN|nr:type VII secretion protein EccB [Kineosporia mesophila]MCD5348805.1 type VII secretion protein EccB [Kineosporia mesophila]
MLARRDQVEAHNYLLARLNSALVRADPDAIEPPGRRDTRAFVIGLVVMALALGGTAGWALLFDSGSLAWKEPGTLIVDKSTGSRYLMNNDKLHPVLNTSSARLLVGSDLTTSSVSTSKLNEVPHGTPVGIPGAPDMLPDASLLNSGVWRVCLTTTVSTGTTGATGSTGGKGAAAAVLSGTAVGSAGELGLNVQIGVERATDRPGDDTGFLVTSGGKEYLIWKNQHLLVQKPWVADVLGYATATPLKVPARWLALMSAGPTLGPVSLKDAGRAGPKIGADRMVIGQLVTVQSAGTETHYMVTAKGLAALSETQYALASAAPGTPQQRQITAADLAAVPRDTLPAAQQQVPAQPPALDQSMTTTSPCLEYPGTSEDGSAEVVRATVAETERPEAGSAAVSVSVVSGGGAQVGTAAALAARDQPQTLVDDTGTAYSLSEDAITALGFAADQAAYIPAGWLQLLPQGPRLTTPGEG